MLKKGDLVRLKSSVSSFSYEKYDFDVAVVLTDPIVTVFTKSNERGKTVLSEEKIVVDLLVGARHVKNCPVDLICKYDK
jgi:hypothetical protein